MTETVIGFLSRECKVGQHDKCCGKWQGLGFEINCDCMCGHKNGWTLDQVELSFIQSIEKSLPSEQASDMTIAQRLCNYVTLLSVVNIDRRPRLVTRSEGDPIEKICPFAMFEDLQESVYLMEYSNGVRPYVLEWYNEVFLKEYNEKINAAATNDGNPTEARLGLASRELANATFGIKQRKLSSQQVLENYVNPLINAGHIDKVENEKDKRSYLFYPVLNVKQKKLFDVTDPNNLSQQKAINVVDPTTYPDRNYLISKIQGVLKYSSQIHKITKLENHEGKEITVEELVDQYYKDPDKYFEVNGSKSNAASTSGGTAIAVSKTSIQPLENKNSKKDDVSDEYSLDAKNRGKSQQIFEKDIKSIQNHDEEYTKLFGESESNNFLIFKCYYCNSLTHRRWTWKK